MSEKQKKQAVQAGLGVVQSLLGDLWSRSQARKDGMSFEEFQAEKLKSKSILAPYSSTPHFEKPPTPNKIIADYLSDNLRPIAFKAQDTLDEISATVDKAGAQVARELLRALGLN